MLRIVAQRLKTLLMTNRMIARLGGDEFVVLLERITNEGAAREVARRLLAEALDQDEFELHYQPQVRGENEELVGVEALLRWNRDGDPISPTMFVPELEETGLIVPVGQWVIRTALGQLAQWRKAGVVVPGVAVNISPLQLAHSDFADCVAKVLDDVGLPPSMLEIEVTERVVLADDRITRANLAALRAMGVQLALDDFGTGFASLSCLHRNPVDTLKVDQSFVADLDSNARSHSIVGSILDLGHRLGMRVVAEGVERPEQAEILRREGCDVLQGFLFGRPQIGAIPPRALVPALA